MGRKRRAYGCNAHESENLVGGVGISTVPMNHHRQEVLGIGRSFTKNLCSGAGGKGNCIQHTGMRRLIQYKR